MSPLVQTMHRDTVSRVGVFCSLVNAIEMCKTEGVVDVFQVVKALRIQKPGAVLTVVRIVIFNGGIVYTSSFFLFYLLRLNTDLYLKWSKCFLTLLVHTLILISQSCTYPNINYSVFCHFIFVDLLIRIYMYLAM